MRTSEWLNFAVAGAGAMTGLLAVIENIFPPPPDANGRRVAWALGFIVLFVSVLILMFLQLRASNKEHTDDEQRAKRLRDEDHQAAEQQTHILHNQIDSLGQLVLQKNETITKLTQADIDVRQRQLMLQYAVIITLVYQNHQFQIYNGGKTNLYLWGDRLSDGPRSIEDHSVTIPPQSYYYLFAGPVETEILQKVGVNKQARTPFEIYISDDLGRKHVAEFNLLIQTSNGKVAIHTQMIKLRDVVQF